MFVCVWCLLSFPGRKDMGTPVVGMQVVISLWLHETDKSVWGFQLLPFLSPLLAPRLAPLQSIWFNNITRVPVFSEFCIPFGSQVHITAWRRTCHLQSYSCACCLSTWETEKETSVCLKLLWLHKNQQDYRICASCLQTCDVPLMEGQFSVKCLYK